MQQGHAEVLAGQASVIDGDTIEIHGQRIRLLDVDAPESRQLCTDGDSVAYPCGRFVALALSEWIGRRNVSCASIKRDRYQRHLADCSVGDQDIAGWLAANGLAVPYCDCKCEVIRSLAGRAWEAQIGIWAGEFQMPWEWRKGK